MKDPGINIVAEIGASKMVKKAKISV
jgi:hypothetical protein